MRLNVSLKYFICKYSNWIQLNGLSKYSSKMSVRLGIDSDLFESSEERILFAVSCPVQFFQQVVGHLRVSH